MSKDKLKSFIKSSLNQEAKFNINHFANPSDRKNDAYGLFGTNIDPYILTKKRSSTIEAKLDRLNSLLETKLKIVGCGSSRCTYILDSKKLIKAAKKVSGIAQNEAEYSFYKNNPMLHSFIPTIFKTDGKNNIWMIVELVNPFDDKDNERWYDLMGFEFGFLYPTADAMVVENISNRDEVSEYVLDGYQKHYGSSPQAQERMVELTESFTAQLDALMDFVNKAIKPLAKTKLLLGDVAGVLENWGMTADGRVVLLDTGYTEKVSDTFYSEQ